jgi:hypothetical protein
MTPTLIAVRLVIRLKRALEQVGVRRRADVYVDCIGEWRYPAFLAAALRRCGVRVLEVPERQALAAWSAEGFRRFVFATRLLHSGAVPTAPVVVAREPGRLPGAPRSRVRVSVDWFSSEARENALVMPYFASPDLHRRRSGRTALRSGERPIRVGFAGAMDAAAYRDRFAFPMPSRSDVLEEILRRFAGRVVIVRSRAELGRVDAAATPIVIATAAGRHVLRGRDYLAFLGRCAFFLAPPGVRMPLSHNLVEGMSVGTIPILSYEDWLDPPLRDGVDCLAYRTTAGLGEAVERALSLGAGEIARLRANVVRHHAEHLTVDSFARRLCPQLERSPTIVVNSERESTALWRARRGP